MYRLRRLLHRACRACSGAEPRRAGSDPPVASGCRATGSDAAICNATRTAAPASASTPTAAARSSARPALPRLRGPPDPVPYLPVVAELARRKRDWDREARRCEGMNRGAVVPLARIERALARARQKV
ncbi:MAG: hypothetical protein MZV65_52710 [Chromatiales bacterium]|nr:hypothetical protein [Chromatiales bacterium]